MKDHLVLRRCVSHVECDDQHSHTYLLTASQVSCYVKVKEMENIIRKRHPNSLPAVIWAAASVPLPEHSTTKTPSVEYLEGRIHKLESDMELKDDDAKRSMRTLEQKYNSMKV